MDLQFGRYGRAGSTPQTPVTEENGPDRLMDLDIQMDTPSGESRVPRWLECTLFIFFSPSPQPISISNSELPLPAVSFLEKHMLMLRYSHNPIHPTVHLLPHLRIGIYIRPDFPNPIFLRLGIDFPDTLPPPCAGSFTFGGRQR